MIKYKVTLTKEERELLMSYTRKGSHTAKKVIHSLILLNVDQGPYAENPQTNEEVCKVLKIGMRTIDRVKQRFVLEGLDAALGVAPTTRVYDKKVDGDLEARLISIACSEPPKGFGKWSLRLLADRMVELNYVDDISHETVRKVLKKTNLSLGGSKVG
ncbi:MAG: helix-turn-helix domain-containing protein [Bacteroidales bacterium]|nr:helix-turn-helix domain-containing protein [Bacteroidales bacterium]